MAATWRGHLLKALAVAAALSLALSLYLFTLTPADHALGAQALGVGFLGGLVGGLLGLGAGLIVVPLTAFVLGFPWHLAVGTSLVQAFFTYTAALYNHHRQGNVRFRLALPLLIGAAVGAPLGALASMQLSESVLTLVFLAVLAGVAFHVVRDHFKRGRTEAGGIDLTSNLDDEQRRTMLRASQRLLGRRLGSLLVVTLTTPIQGSFAGHRYQVDRVTPLAMGAGVGFASGLLGVGGGFLLTPLIITGLSLPAHLAVGTGLVVVTGNTLFGGLTHLLHGNVNLVAAAFLAAGGMTGAALGSRCSQALSEGALRGLFLAVLAVVGWQIAPL